MKLIFRWLSNRIRRFIVLASDCEIDIEMENEGFTLMAGGVGSILSAIRADRIPKRNEMP